MERFESYSGSEIEAKREALLTSIEALASSRNEDWLAEKYGQVTISNLSTYDVNPEDDHGDYNPEYDGVDGSTETLFSAYKQVYETAEGRVSTVPHYNVTIVESQSVHQNQLPDAVFNTLRQEAIDIFIDTHEQGELESDQAEEDGWYQILDDVYVRANSEDMEQSEVRIDGVLEYVYTTTYDILDDGELASCTHYASYQKEYQELITNSFSMAFGDYEDPISGDLEGQRVEGVGEDFVFSDPELINEAEHYDRCLHVVNQFLQGVPGRDDEQGPILEQ